MKPLSKNHLIIYSLSVVSVLLAIVLCSFCISIYQGARKNIKTIIDKKLPEIAEEYRISYLSFSGVPLYSNYSQKDLLPNPNKNGKINRNGIFYQLDDSIRIKENFVQISKRIYYTSIFTDEPINRDSLLYIQSKILSDVGFKGKSALLITTEKERRWFSAYPDTLFVTDALVSKPFISGLSDEVRLQLFVENSVKSIVAFAKPEKPLIVCALFLFASIFCLTGYVIKIRFFNAYRTGYGSLVLWEKERRISLNGETLEINNQIYTLLSLFIKDPEHVVPFEVIDRTFWTEKEANRARRQTLISKLRVTLQRDNRFSLKITQKMGYVLEFDRKRKNGKKSIQRNITE